MTLAARIALATTLALQAVAIAAAAEPFSPAYRMPPLAPAPETGVALAADRELLLYGSAAEDEPGAAALFDGARGTLRFALDDPSPGPSDGYGRAVAASARYLVVGAVRQEAVHVFDRRGTLLRTFANPDPGSFNGFGSAVAATGDVVAVGAPLGGARGAETGALFLLDVRTGALIRRIDGAAAGASFGAAVAALGSRVVAGAPGSVANQGAPGAVLAFEARSGNPLWQASASAPSAGDGFGAALAAVDGRLIVGAPFADADGADAGAAFLLRPQNGSIVEVFRNPTGQADQFGAAVALGGGVAIVGAPAADALEENAGAAYVFTPGARLLQTLVPDPTAFCGAAGVAVASGTRFVAVGARDCFGAAAVYGYARRAPTRAAALASLRLVPARARD